MTTGFLADLAADGPAPGHAAALALYGRFVGDWDILVRHMLPDGTLRERPGTWRFGWVLGGRAVQDVWILPARAGHDEPAFHGTTLRMPLDPAGAAWHIHYADPSVPLHTTQTGRAEAAEIVQLGTDADGTRRRWRFTAITPGGFRWLGEVARPDGSWFRHTDFTATRRAG